MKSAGKFYVSAKVLAAYELVVLLYRYHRKEGKDCDSHEEDPVSFGHQELVDHEETIEVRSLCYNNQPTRLQQSARRLENSPLVVPPHVWMAQLKELGEDGNASVVLAKPLLSMSFKILAGTVAEGDADGSAHKEVEHNQLEPAHVEPQRNAEAELHHKVEGDDEDAEPDVAEDEHFEAPAKSSSNDGKGEGGGQRVGADGFHGLGSEQSGSQVFDHLLRRGRVDLQYQNQHYQVDASNTLDDSPKNGVWAVEESVGEVEGGVEDDEEHGRQQSSNLGLSVPLHAHREVRLVRHVLKPRAHK